jgi:hypothetical protein
MVAKNQLPDEAEGKGKQPVEISDKLFDCLG